MILPLDFFFTWSVIATALLLYFYYWYKRPNHFPLGPKGVPFLGVLPFLGKHPERVMKKWSRKYGSVMAVRFGPKDVIVLNDFDAIQQAYVKQPTKFSGRPQLEIVNQTTGGFGVAFADYGHHWKVQRKFGLMTLREFGMGKLSMEGKILEEVSYFSDTIRSQNGKAFNIHSLLTNAVANIICCIGFGKRFDYDDEYFKDILRRFIQVIEGPLANVFFLLATFSPVVMKIPPLSLYNKMLVREIEDTIAMLEGIIKENEETFDEHNIRNFIDAFLLEMKKKTDDSFHYKQLVQYVRDFFEAGSETTSSTLYWSLLCLLHYPQVQDKLRKEIVDVVGFEGKVTTQKRSEMPYTCAFMEEVFRFRTLLPLGIQHSTSEDAQLGDYIIPKGTQILANFWAVHNDETVWEKPEIFNPDRFLDEEGNFVRSPHVIPFSVGPRHCLGEQLARMEFFIFLVSIVRRFELLPDPNAKKLPDLSGSNGFIFVPKPYKLVAKEI